MADIESSVAIINSIYLHLCFKNPYSWNDFAWMVQIIGGLGTPTSIFVAVFLFYRQQKSDIEKREREDKERIYKTCHAILKEICSQKKLLDMPYNEQEITERLGMIINTHAYDSIVNSGLFTHFKTDTQNQLSSLYPSIKQRNELVTYRDRFADIFIIADFKLKGHLFLDRANYYDNAIETLDKEIKFLLDVVKMLIEKELSKSRHI